MSLVVYGHYPPAVQINGQKIIGLWAKFNAYPDMEFKEIFVGHIPRELSEMDLLRVFAQIGPIWKLRLMMNFSGQNRGFGYVQYISEEHHKMALSKLNGYEIIPGHRLSVCTSRNICTLIMGGLNRNLVADNVLNQLYGLVKFKCASYKFEKDDIRYYLRFPTHREAAIGRRTIISVLSYFGYKGWIKWAEQ